MKTRFSVTLLARIRRSLIKMCSDKGDIIQPLQLTAVEAPVSGYPREAKKVSRNWSSVAAYGNV